MAIRQVRERVWGVGVIDWDRTIFDELIPLPDGTTYNAYLVQGSEKTALLDTVDPSKIDDFLVNLQNSGVKHLDYLVAHHAEQDHSGVIPIILERFPETVVVTNSKARGFLKDLLGLADDRFLEVADGESLSLGDKTLQFISTPWVHWPETMCSYLPEERILFSGDWFGSHYATTSLFAGDNPQVLRAAKRYFAEIMMPFRTTISKNLDKIAGLELDLIAPTHGPLYDHPEVIVNSYRQWVSDEVQNLVIIPYVSMHHSTQKMVDYLVNSLVDKGVQVKPFNLTVTDIGELAISLVDAATLVLAAPTLLVGPHPLAVSAAYLANALKPKTRYAAIIGSYGWGSKMVETISGMLTNFKGELLPPVLSKGFPGEADFDALEQLAAEIARRHESLRV